MMVQARFRISSGLLLWLCFLGASLRALLSLDSGPLAAPTLGLAEFSDWLALTEAPTATFVVLRLVALGAGAYLMATTVLAIGLRLLRADVAAAVVESGLPSMIRRLVRATAGLSVASTLAVGVANPAVAFEGMVGSAWRPAIEAPTTTAVPEATERPPIMHGVETSTTATTTTTSAPEGTHRTEPTPTTSTSLRPGSQPSRDISQGLPTMRRVDDAPPQAGAPRMRRLTDGPPSTPPSTTSTTESPSATTATSTTTTTTTTTVVGRAPAPRRPSHVEPARSQPLAPSRASAGTWTVEPGDHLWSIAARTLAASWHRRPTDGEVDPYWRRLIADNRDTIANPDLIYPGDTVELPPLPPRPGL